MKARLYFWYGTVFLILAAALLRMLIAKRMGNICFYALVLSAIGIALFRLRPGELSFAAFLKKYWPLHLAMAGPLLAILINQCALVDFSGRSYDYPSRMAFFAVMAWAAVLLPWPLLRRLQWAMVIGAFLAAIKMYLITEGGTVRTYVDFMPIIEFAQMAQLLGFFSLLTIGFAERNPNPLLRQGEILLKLGAGGAGLYAAYLSQTRGAWIGIPVLLLISIVMLMRRRLTGRHLAIFGVLLVVAVVTFGSTSLVQARFGKAYRELTAYLHNESQDTSVGVRLQLWKGSLQLFREHPFVGVGREQFPDALKDLERRGIITEAASGQPHSHNEFLYNLATLGIFGGIALLCLYFVPAAYFWRESRSPDRKIRAIAGMGLILCSGFVILGLTDVMFMWGASDNFYGIIAAILFAMLVRRKQYLAVQEDMPGSSKPMSMPL